MSMTESRHSTHSIRSGIVYRLTHYTSLDTNIESWTQCISLIFSDERQHLLKGINSPLILPELFFINLRNKRNRIRNYYHPLDNQVFLYEVSVLREKAKNQISKIITNGDNHVAKKHNVLVQGPSTSPIRSSIHPSGLDTVGN